MNRRKPSVLYLTNNPARITNYLHLSLCKRQVYFLICTNILKLVKIRKNTIIFVAIYLYLCYVVIRKFVIFTYKTNREDPTMQKDKNRLLLDCMVVGFALFSMFFGAGNVVFPPYLGMQTGTAWFGGFLYYFIADIGLAMLTMFAILKGRGTDAIVRPIGKIPSAILMSAIILCIGPMLAIPRTAATTYEMAIVPLAPSVPSVLFSVLFFLLILALSVRESAVVDIVGKILTPLLLLGLAALIIKGVVSPLGKITTPPTVGSVAATGILSGYQTMDVLAAMAFGVLILQSADKKGYQDLRGQQKLVSGAALLAGALLMLVYLGLTYLGATVAKRFDFHIDRADLVLRIVEMLMGRVGTVIFGVVVGLACVTTAVALVSSAVGFFAKLSGGRLRYSWLVIVICVFSAAAANLGLDGIIAIAAPILNIVYPPTLVLVILSFFGDKIPSIVHRFAAGGSILISILNVVTRSGARMPILKQLPLASMDLGWLVPAVVCGLIGFVIVLIRKKA